MAVVPRLVGSEPWVPQQDNPEFLTAEQARDAIAAAGLTVGTCEVVGLRIEAPGRVVGQDPPPGTEVPPDSSVNVTVKDRGCDILTAP